MKKKVLALVLCLAMVLSVLPMSAFAAENEGITYVDRTWDDTAKMVVETEKECEDFIVVDENTTAFDDGKWYAVKNSITVDERIAVNGTANLILCDGYTLTVPFGIENATGDTLNIYGQSNDSGVLSITKSKQYKPAIGASEDDSITGNVNIYGGTVAATGGSYAAGIGSGTYAGKDSGNVAVFGGSVTAKSKSDGAGIGGGHLRNGGTLTVYGGTVNATGGSSGAGIGGGNKGCGGTVTVYGGTVNATGGVYAAGIGSGNGEGYQTEQARNGGSVCIYGGTVTAKGKDGGAGIGGGFYADGADVYIGGGSVTASSTKSRAIGGGMKCGSHGTLTVPVIMALKAGDAEPGTEMTVEEYEQTGYKYANIYENFIAKGENWYIDKEFVLHLTGAVTNTSTTIDNTPWKEYKTDIVAVVAEDGAKVTNCDRLFSNCTNLKSVDIAKLDIAGTTTMRYMFSGCPSLESLDLSTLDTSSVTSMMCMFYNASGLKSINVSGWNTSNVNDMQYMFNNCASLTELDLSSFDTSKVTTVYTMFYMCSKLEKLNIGNFSGDNLTSTDFVLSSCPALAEITVNGNALQKLADPISKLSSVWYCKDTHRKYTTAAELMTVTGKVTLSKTVENIAEGTSWYLDGIGCLHLTGKIEQGNDNPPEWYDFSDRIYSVIAEEGSAIQGIGSLLFYKCANLTTVDLHLAEKERLYTEWMFWYLEKLESVNLSDWSSGSLMYIQNLFVNCPALAVVDISNTDLRFLSETNNSIFADCGALREIRIDSALMQYAADHLMSVSAAWKNAEDGTIYESVDDLMALTGTVTLLRVCDHVWAEATCTEPKTCTLCGLTEGNANASAHHWAAATCAAPKICTRCGLSQGLTDSNNHAWGKTAENAVKVCEHCGFIQGDGWYIPDGETLYISGDIHNEDDYSPWNAYKEVITTLIALDGAKIESGYRLFRDCANLTEADLSLLDTSDCTTMGGMFSYCKKLTKLDMSNFDTSAVIDMSRMFMNCASLKEINLNGIDTQKVTDMSAMFFNCLELTSIDFGSIHTENVTDMSGMFAGCRRLASLNLNAFDTKNVVSMAHMFSTTGLKTLDLTGFDTAKVKDMSELFYECGELTSVDLSSFDTAQVTDMRAMFMSCSSLTSLDVSGFITDSLEYAEGMFRGCSSLSSLDVSRFDTSSVNNMSSMFEGCSSLTSLDLSGFITGSLQYAEGMFRGCSSLTSLDVSRFDTSSVFIMNQMFSGCRSLTSIDLRGFDTSSVAVMNEMFCGCNSLTALGITPDILRENADDIIEIRSPWYKQGSTVSYSTAGDLKAVTDIVTLRDVYTYTVNVQNDGNGTASANPAVAAKDETVTLTATPNTGYHFKEWQSSDVTVSNNTFTMPEKDVTVKAIFEADAPTTYTVTFDANGGSVTPTSAVTGTDGKLVSLPTPTRSGSYRFNGWYTAASGGTKVTVDNVYPADTTIYAHWTYTGGGVTYYTLTFNTNGGSAISSVSGTYGKVIDLDKYVPTKSGFDFGGWYSDKALTNPVYEIKLNGNKTVYAKWIEKSVVFPFTDVKETDWSYDDIYYVWEKCLMQGTSTTTFSPKMTTSRGMIVTILYRLAGEPAVSGTCPFTDVKSGSYYEKAITWAAANKIVSGYGDGKFGADDPITREQMATILYRFAEFMGYDVSAKANLSGYTDAGNISAYAKDALAWANAKGLVTGTSATTLSPKGIATREQVAAILHRFCENIVK